MELSWNSIKADPSFIFIFQKLLKDSKLDDSNIEEIIEFMLPGIIDIKTHYFEKYIIPKNKEDIKNRSLVVGALDTGLEIMTCLKFDELQEAYNSYADKEMSKIKAIAARDEGTLVEKTFNFKPYVPTLTDNADENRGLHRYDDRDFEDFVQGLIIQVLIILNYPIIHIHDDQIKDIFFKRTTDVKERDLNVAPNRFIFYPHLFYNIMITNTYRLA